MKYHLRILGTITVILICSVMEPVKKFHAFAVWPTAKEFCCGKVVTTLIIFVKLQQFLHKLNKKYVCIRLKKQNYLTFFQPTLFEFFNFFIGSRSHGSEAEPQHCIPTFGSNDLQAVLRIRSPASI